MLKTAFIPVNVACDGTTGTIDTPWFEMKRDFPELVANTLIEFDSRFQLLYNQKASAVGNNSSAIAHSIAALSHPAFGPLYLYIIHVVEASSGPKFYLYLSFLDPSTITSAIRISNIIAVTNGTITTVYPCSSNSDKAMTIGLQLATIDNSDFFAIGISSYLLDSLLYHHFIFDSATNLLDGTKHPFYMFNVYSTNPVLYSPTEDGTVGTYYARYSELKLPWAITEDNEVPVCIFPMLVGQNSTGINLTGQVLDHCVATGDNMLIPMRKYLMDGEQCYSLSDFMLVKE